MESKTRINSDPAKNLYLGRGLIPTGTSAVANQLMPAGSLLYLLNEWICGYIHESVTVLHASVAEAAG